MKLSNVQTHEDEDKGKQQFSGHSHWENTSLPTPEPEKSLPTLSFLSNKAI